MFATLQSAVHWSIARRKACALRWWIKWKKTAWWDWRTATTTTKRQLVSSSLSTICTEAVVGQRRKKINQRHLSWMTRWLFYFIFFFFLFLAYNFVHPWQQYDTRFSFFHFHSWWMLVGWKNTTEKGRKRETLALVRAKNKDQYNELLHSLPFTTW